MQHQISEVEVDSPVYYRVSTLWICVFNRGNASQFGWREVPGTGRGLLFPNHRFESRSPEDQRRVLLGEFLLQLSPSKGRGVRDAISSQLRSMRLRQKRGSGVHPSLESKRRTQIATHSIEAL